MAFSQQLQRPTFQPASFSPGDLSGPSTAAAQMAGRLVATGVVAQQVGRLGMFSLLHRFEIDAYGLGKLLEGRTVSRSLDYDQKKRRGIIRKLRVERIEPVSEERR